MKPPEKIIFLILTVFILSFYLVGCSNAVTPNKSAQSANTAERATEKNVPTQGPQTIITPVSESLLASSDSPDQETGEEIYQGIPVGFTPEGFPYRGDPQSPLILEEYSDYLCPFCGRHFTQTFPGLVEKYVAEGKLKYVFRDMPLVSLHPTAPAGHEAALCVGEQGAALYWQMHDELFATQSQWGSLPDPSNFLSELARKVGADMSAYEACLKSGETKEKVTQGVIAGENLGFSGTPSFQFIRTQDSEKYTLVGAYPIGTFNQWVDALLAGEEPPQAAQEEQEQPELPYWANQEGLAPDPARPGYTLAGDQYKGNPQAKVVVVEFSDFQCPACQQHELEIQPVIDKALVDDGKIMWVFKHLPLQEHAQSLVAATAAECAADQGKFWEMDHLLFEKQALWSQENPEPTLVELARSLGLDTEAFSFCLNSRAPLERVFNDFYDSQGITGSTPTFIILSGGRGTRLQGSREAEQFVKLLQGVIDQATPTP